MVDEELYAQIRDCERSGLSMRETALELKLSRNTVKKYWNGGSHPELHKEREQHASKTKQAILDRISAYLTDNKDNTAVKQKIRANTVHAYLTNKCGIDVSMATVARYMNELKAGHVKKSYLTLEFDCGHTAMSDWFEFYVNYKGNKTKLYAFIMILAYSYAPFVAVYTSMKEEEFLHGHVSAFNFYGGIIRRCVTDNQRVAVVFGSGAKAKMNAQYKLLRDHYGFVADFCNGYSPYEKGLVEAAVKVGRNFYTPVPTYSSLEELQDLAYAGCVNYIKTHKIQSVVKKGYIRDWYAEEKKTLQPLPRTQFDPFMDVTVKVNNKQLFVFNKASYSVPPEYIGMKLSLRVFPFNLNVMYKGELICTHRRSIIEGENQIVAEHFIQQFIGKHRFSDNSYALRSGILPPGMDVFRDRCQAIDKFDQLRKMLLLLRDNDRDKVLYAVSEVCKQDNPSYEMVEAMLGVKLNEKGDVKEEEKEERKRTTEEDPFRKFKGILGPR